LRHSVASPTIHDQQKLFARLLIVPAMLVLLLVAVFPLIYMILVSFQGITMMDNRFFWPLLCRWSYSSVCRWRNFF